MSARTTTLTPTAKTFEAFYSAVHGRSPRDWQVRAAVEMRERTTQVPLDAGDASKKPLWKAVSLPTGTGKTTLIDCFLFALACASTQRPRPIPLRLFWVVDRRNVVDQVFSYARDVARAIDEGATAVTAQVRARLLELGMPGDSAHGDHVPVAAVDVRLWRGGLTDIDLDRLAQGDPTASGLASVPLSPISPAVVCSTVDQVGSRMLFRGYGVSRGSRPIEAALTTMDSIVVLDEAHIARPFLQTARAISTAQPARRLPVAPAHVISMSATNPDTAVEVFELSDADRSEPEIARIFSASKRMKLVRARDPAQAAAEHVIKLATRSEHKLVGVVMNLVADARAVTRRLAVADVDVRLVIGPVRPFDRAAIVGEIPSRPAREEREAPLVIVGTQTLEVGLDIDFDVLITACAPLPSLIQRVGRLDRTGVLGTSDGLILSPPRHDLVYGYQTEATWSWLEEQAEDGVVDFGIAAMSALLAASPPPERAALSAQPEAPILAPWHIELLAMTSEDLAVSPAVEPFLRESEDSADVQICWRCDLEAEMEKSDMTERLRQRPPHVGELLSVSVGATRRWLREESSSDALPDLLQGTDPFPEKRDAPARAGRPAMRIPPRDGRGILSPELIHADQLRPGDVIAAPSSYGGCDRFGWNPGSRRAVEDLGSLNPHRPRLLLSHRLTIDDAALSDQELSRVADVRADLESDLILPEDGYLELLSVAQAWLERAFTTPDDGVGSRSIGVRRRLTETVIERLSGDPSTASGEAVRLGGGDVLLTAPSVGRRKTRGKPKLYEHHASEVAARARSHGEALGVGQTLIRTLELAGWNHDAGKLDPRFQAWLNGGSPDGSSEPLAKSGRDPNDPISRRQRRSAGWPAGKRHEATSAALIDSLATDRWGDDIDLDLLGHLVIAHHGEARPHRPVPSPSDPVEVSASIVVSIDPVARVTATVDSEAETPWHKHAARFERLNRVWGYWGLALLEAAFVLADRAVSAEQRLEDSGGEE